MKLLLRNQNNLLDAGKSKLIENIKILLYKENPRIFETIDFENDDIYQEPLLFSYFNCSNRESMSLELILYGYTKLDMRPDTILVNSDEFGRIYLPGVGWLITEKKNQNYKLLKDKNKEFKLFFDNEICNFFYEPRTFVKGTNIELLKYPISYFKQFYYDVNQNLIEVEIEKITKKHMKNVIKAFNLIEQYIPFHYELISAVTRKITVFNVDTTLRNSFATIRAQGAAFFNAYQNNYNEVFFVDDIAHQTGHIIFNTLIYETKIFLKANPKMILDKISLAKEVVETRDVYTLFHALYTYYTTLICFDVLLENNVFKKEKKHEALGRMKFYIEKCYQDLLLVDTPFNSQEGSEKLFTKEGLKIYLAIKENFKQIANKWLHVIKEYKLSNQPYNFSYSKFVELNPFYEKTN